ncbi:MAG TPA: D-alanyl-D-alanine carboxypeptidase/D-alanyl-D-alanine-endopeptidase [Bryobacteraceae bacterium]|nr:D-alanyl-D-alanine carboxypeptidase/D-alanyl-D-alanine-endopeptidase [Bryobacteraceae bacterium]
MRVRFPAVACALLACCGGLRAASLAERIDQAIQVSDGSRTAFWGIEVTDIASGQTLYELNSHRFFVPASNTKLFTTALALTRLGPDYTFRTRVLAENAPDAAGRVHGALTLAGGGDPNLSGREIPYRVNSPAGNPLAAMEDLANQVAARGVKRVDGDIVGDDTFYVWEPYSEGWSVDDLAYDYGGAVSALSMNDNMLTVTVRPSSSAGELAMVMLNPPVEFYRIENRIRTVESGERRVEFERDPGGWQVRLSGSVAVHSPAETLALGISDPARYAALALRQALEARGIAVGGGAVSRHLYRDEVPDLTQGAAPKEIAGVELARRVSAPLVEDLRITDKVSQNLHAEMALRAVGRARRNVGSVEAGMEEMRGLLSEAGVDSGSWNFSDGSGLGRLNLVTPSAVVKLLRYMMASPLHDTWFSLLPVAGRDGTLSDRFSNSPAAGRVFAKSGTETHVSALSGYAHRADGSWLAFSLLANNYNGSTAEIRSVMDNICAILVQ